MTFEVPLSSLGAHQGLARKVARGIRLASRPYVSRWGTDYLEPADALSMACSLLPSPDGAKAITWIPGHDGSPGPGFDLARALSHAWGLPLTEGLVRVRHVRSAHSSSCRPSAAESWQSLRPCGPPRSDGILVDNVVASGGSMSAAISMLVSEGGWTNLRSVSVSTDLTAGCKGLLDSDHAGWCGACLRELKERLE